MCPWYGNERHEGHLHPNLSTEGALHAEWVKAASGAPGKRAGTALAPRGEQSGKWGTAGGRARSGGRLVSVASKG
jgi:hypothetical protein